MARASGETIRKAYELQDNGLSGVKIAAELQNKNIGAYLRLRSILESGEMPPDAGSKYSLPACKDFIDNYLNKPEDIETKVDYAPDTELSAKDKKELAMYALDQYLFFLKQLMGVI